MALDAARRTPEGTQRAVAAWGRARVKVNAMQTAVAHLGGGWRGDSVRDAVESALDAEDITPLVRLALNWLAAYTAPLPHLAPACRVGSCSSSVFQSPKYAQMRISFALCCVRLGQHKTWHDFGVPTRLVPRLKPKQALRQVRMAFDAPGKAAAEATPQEDAEEDGGDRGTEGRPATQAAGASASAVLAMLQRVAEEQASEISQISRCGTAAVEGKHYAAECVATSCKEYMYCQGPTLVRA